MQGVKPLQVGWRSFETGVHLFTTELRVPDDLGLIPGLQGAYEYWQGKRGARPFAARAALDPVEMREFLPRIMLADITRDPLRFRYRLCGTGICYAHTGGDPTGLAVDELEPAQYGALIHTQYDDMLKKRAPVAHLNVFSSADRYKSYAHIILPLSRGGEDIDMLMTVDSLIQDQAEMMTVLKQLQDRK
jgi:hypothetical protein